MAQLELAARQVEQARQEIAAKNAQLQEMIDQQDRFIGMAAHDLRNPLTVIIGYSDLLREDLAGFAPTEEMMEIVNVIAEAAQRMLGLVEGTLDVASISKGKVGVRPQQVHLKSFMEGLDRGYRMLARQKEIVFSATAPDTLFCTDPLRVSQILDNLVSNAFKYSGFGSRTSVTASVEQGWLVITVEDSGPGISESDVTRLFGYFQTGFLRTTGGERSFGLGLAIVRSLLEAMRGSISVKSVLGQGTTFVVRIPDGGDAC